MDWDTIVTVVFVVVLWGILQYLVCWFETVRRAAACYLRQHEGAADLNEEELDEEERNEGDTPS